MLPLWKFTARKVWGELKTQGVNSFLHARLGNRLKHGKFEGGVTICPRPSVCFKAGPGVGGGAPEGPGGGGFNRRGA